MNLHVIFGTSYYQSYFELPKITNVSDVFDVFLIVAP